MAWDYTPVDDGDPSDALVFVGEPTFPGCHIRARPIGLFRMTDEKGEDKKIPCEGHKVSTDGFEDRAAAERVIDKVREQHGAPRRRG